jgi:uncharacterized protein YPO0396
VTTFENVDNNATEAEETTLLDDATETERIQVIDDFDALFALPPTEVQPAPAATAAISGPRGPVDPGPVQWKAETFQLVNWGGFEGRHVFSFAPGSTLVSGGSGTGKSTLLDAYIALMMPGDVSFNGASNDAGGRARNPDQRNLLSYLRGKTDTTSDAGQAVDKVLRGAKSATWGAVGMTFRNDQGRYFTALRIYYVPARAARSSDITMRLATIDEELDLALLEALADTGDANQRFANKALKATFTGIQPYTTYGDFAQALYSRLDIGANGDGEKALRLLVRIQAGTKISTVDALYKETVLEKPTTYVRADQAIEHFDDLDAAYQAMITEQKKAEVLAPITTWWENSAQARQGLATLDALGQGAQNELTPLALWSRRTRARLLDVAVDDNRRVRSEKNKAHTEAAEEEKAAENALKVARQSHHEAGGSSISQLDSKIVEREKEQHARAGRLARLLADTHVLEATFTNAAEHGQWQQASQEFLTRLPEATKTLRSRRDGLRDQQRELLIQRTRLREERGSLEGRSGRVHLAMDQMRQAVAKAAGMDPQDLPFVAELVDVDPDESSWRAAIETVLYPSARIMLVPAERLQHFSAAIDSLSLKGRLNFQGVQASSSRPSGGDRRRISGKLLYKDSPFSQWVFDHVNAPARNALCVQGPQDLDGEDLRVTPNGQTRQGQRGAHGRQDSTNIIGFSSKEAIAEIDAELKQLEEPLSGLDTRIKAVEDEEVALAARKSAHEAISRMAWTEIDTDSVTAEIGQHRERRQQILDGDRRLSQLSTEIETLEQALKNDLIPTRSRLDDAIEKLKAQYGDLVDRQDENSRVLERIEADGGVLLTEGDATWLDQQLAAVAAPGDPDKLSDLDANLGRLTRSLAGERKDQEVKASDAERELCRVFTQYKSFWPDPNLGESVESYHDYAAILREILTNGLHERRHEWRRRLTTWSGEDLVPLSSSLDTAVEEIEDRLVPINDILATLPFGAGGDRLRIKLRKLNSAAVSTFRAHLRQLAAGATRDLADLETEQRFKELQEFMATIRGRDDEHLTPQLRQLSNRDNLLDVRRHVEITAERYGDVGQLLSTYASIADKSGGETQELAAFIVGGALRFRLGDEQRSRPRFAPVFLDEGFIKADSEFAGRAVEAWKGLGFQLIIGAPLDKVSALEPHVDQMLVITKNTANGCSFVAKISDSPSTLHSPVTRNSTPPSPDAAGDSRGPAGTEETW